MLLANCLLYFSVQVSAVVQPCMFDDAGVNVYVDNDLNVVHNNETRLPILPDGAPTISYGHINRCSNHGGVITIGGTLSMGSSNAYFDYSNEMRRSAQIFLDWLNDERGGIQIHGSSYNMRFRWVDDASSSQQVTKAMAHALRAQDGLGIADFAVAGYSSTLTGFASQQTAANDRLMVAPAAAATSAFAHNNLTFGTLPPAHAYFLSAVDAIVNVASVTRRIAATTPVNLRGTNFRRLSGTLKAGFIQVDVTFTKAICQTMENVAASAGMIISSAGVQSIRKIPQVESIMSKLAFLQDDGVDVLFGCTQYSTGIAIIDALERLDYSPSAVVLSSTVALPGYADLIHQGWWQGEYILGVSPWHKTLPQRGDFSGMTSTEFALSYRTLFNQEVSYVGASMFAACSALAASIEKSGSLETGKVAMALQTLTLQEFYGKVGFDSNGQNDQLAMLGLQYSPGAQQAQVVFPSVAVTNATLAFPMPTWAQRRCRAIGPGKTWEDSAMVRKSGISLECSGHGLCNEMGACICSKGWGGGACNKHTTVEETGFPIWMVILIIVGVVVVGLCCGCAYRSHTRKKIKTQASVIESIQKELQELKDSVVGMRSVVSPFTPALDSDEMIRATAPSTSIKERAIWYWAEDAGRLSSHNQNLIFPPHWVQYAGSVAVELEERYKLYESGTAPASYATDLTDRISSTGTEAKSHGQNTGCKYIIDFQTMKQINAQSKYERAVLRRLLPVEPVDQVVPIVPTGSVSIPGDLVGEVFLILQIGSIVQVSKQRDDGWAFGTVISQSEKGDACSLDFAPSEQISEDSGWFPMSCTTMPTKEALSQLSKMMGSAGADCLTPPDTWSDLKDPMVAQLFTLPEGPEKQKVVASFKHTMTASSLKILSVERVQNLSLWQSFAVKRQTVLSREGMSESGLIASNGKSRQERMWLFHGTSPDSVGKITQQGFNRSFCGKNATMYGKGVYFARDASYSSSPTYSMVDASGVQRIFLCRVITGEYCRGQKDALIPKVRDARTNLLYDTTVDNEKDPTIFVTYHDAQAYPEYLVHFRQ